MSPRRVGRTRPCGSADARARLRQARLYLEVATLVASDEPGEHATVATANAVLAGIAAADAMCCAIAGERFRGDDHRRAAEYLGQVTGDTACAGGAARPDRPEGRQPLRRSQRPGPQRHSGSAQGDTACRCRCRPRPRLIPEGSCPLFSGPNAPGLRGAERHPRAPRYPWLSSPSPSEFHANPAQAPARTHAHRARPQERWLPLECECISKTGATFLSNFCWT
jgi:hypothetical protein